MKRILNKLVPLLAFGTLSACGTTYQLPELGEAQSQQANQMFATAQQDGTRQLLSPRAAEQRFQRVSARISRVGKHYCETLTAERKNFDCNVDVAVDRELNERNAYFTYKNDKPVIRISLPMLQDTASDDEVAFILGHEYGHLIGRHIEKQEHVDLR